MRAIIVTLMLVTISLAATANENVRGYMKKDGTYVDPHHRTSPNNRRYDNYSSQGNQNLYTGQPGSERNEFSNPPAYNKNRQRKK